MLKHVSDWLLHISVVQHVNFTYTNLYGVLQQYGLLALLLANSLGRIRTDYCIDALMWMWLGRL